MKLSSIGSMCVSRAAILLSLAFVGLAQAQIIPPGSGLPVPPSVQAIPIGNQPATAAVAQTVTLRWYEPINFITTTTANATHFVVCVQEIATLCTWPSVAQLGVWADSATGSTFTRTPRYSGGSLIGTNRPRIVAGYDYALNVTVDDRYFDRQLKWSVAACSAPDPNACNFAIAGYNWYTTKELVANAILVYQAPDVTITAQAANVGTTRVDGFTSRITGFPALVGRSGSCAIDPNESGLNVVNSTRLVTRDGQIKFAGNYWNGTRYDVSALDVVGIINGTTTFSASTVLGLNPLGPQSQPNLTPMVERRYPVGSLPPQAGVTAQFAVVAISSIDDLGQIKEMNEGDNRWGECSTFFY